MDLQVQGRARSNSSGQQPVQRYTPDPMPQWPTQRDEGQNVVPKHLVKPRGTSRVFTQSIIQDGRGSPWQQQQFLQQQQQQHQYDGEISPPLPDGRSRQGGFNNSNNSSPYTSPTSTPQPTSQPPTQPLPATPPQQHGIPVRQATLQGANIMVKKEPSMAKPVKSLLKVRNPNPGSVPASVTAYANSNQSSPAPSPHPQVDEEDELPRAQSVKKSHVHVEIRQMESRFEGSQVTLEGTGEFDGANQLQQQQQQTRMPPREPLPAPPTTASNRIPPPKEPLPAISDMSKMGGPMGSQATLQSLPPNPATEEEQDPEDEEGDYGADIFNDYRMSMASFGGSLARSNKTNSQQQQQQQPASISQPITTTSNPTPQTSTNPTPSTTAPSKPMQLRPTSQTSEVYVHEEEEEEDDVSISTTSPTPHENGETDEEDYFDFGGYIDEGEVAEADPDAPICAFCEEPIQGEDRPVHILGRYWHVHHSRCKECRRPIGVDNFAEIEGFLYCEDHYYEFKGEFRTRKSNPKKKRASYIERDLQHIQTLSTVRKVRNLFNFEQSCRLNIVTLDSPTSPTASPTQARPRRFVTSFIAPPGVDGAAGILESLDPAVAKQLTGRKMKKGERLGGTGRYASVVGAPRAVGEDEGKKKEKGSGLKGVPKRESPTGSPGDEDGKPSVRDKRVTVLI
ncbi:hypothetical protein HDU97_004343 [Phlyctochytrium planicorne]|nr:hypothetical protein HDU97_004343 [Phlyctochytrium planicorne]